MPEYHEEKEPYEPEVQNLEGKVALVTGGTTGIGRATAILLAKKGVKVVVYGRHEKELQDAMSDLAKTGGEFYGLVADNAEPDQIRRVFDETRNRFGDLDILINNAALPAGSILDTSYEDALYILKVNVLGYLMCMKYAIEVFRRKGGGHIVNIGSMSAKVRETGSDVYVATKGAIEAMSESLRKVVNEENIKISVIEPGQAGSNLAGEPPDVERQVQDQSEMKELEAEDIAHAVYYTLTQPPRSNILELRVAPLKQSI